LVRRRSAGTLPGRGRRPRRSRFALDLFSRKRWSCWQGKSRARTLSQVGLNLQQILNDLGVKRNTWWGYSLHLIGDNVRFPFTAVGMRVDLKRGKWHGPNNGNYDW